MLIRIVDGLAQGLSFRAIGRSLGRAASTVQREVERHKIKEADTVNYQADLADKLSHISRVTSYSSRLKLGKRFDTDLGLLVLENLRKGWSPEQIAGLLKSKENGIDGRVCHETIYKAIYIQPRGELRHELLGYLRKHHKKRMPRSRGGNRKELIGMVNISERPPEVEGRLVPGHWEGDLIKGAGNQSAVGTVIERTSRKCILIKLDSATTESVVCGFTEAFKKIPKDLRKSMTYDQGREMAWHAKLAKETEMDIYFCDPHSPWQRPSNENMNGLLREYLPKGTDLSLYSQDDLDVIADKLNSRPRKVLGFKTPSEVFDSLCKSESVALQG